LEEIPATDQQAANPPHDTLTDIPEVKSDVKLPLKVSQKIRSEGRYPAARFGRQVEGTHSGWSVISP
jgi:hypothetical protein